MIPTREFHETFSCIEELAVNGTAGFVVFRLAFGSVDQNGFCPSSVAKEFSISKRPRIENVN